MSGRNSFSVSFDETLQQARAGPNCGRMAKAAFKAKKETSE
jgi:hypothetical protein